jgi:surfactin synthase thioesterase subunit
MIESAGAWFLSGPVQGQIELKIFCFPYAGGTALVFKKWRDFLPENVQVVPVELPGRGARLQEPPFLSLPVLVEELAGVIWPLLDKPFIFYGHSMGAIIAFELARSLRRRHGLEPLALFVGGCRAPQTPNSEPATYNLPNNEFIKELIRLDGTPIEVIEHAELMDMMVPLLRADFRLTQTYEYTDDTPLRCPITAYGGLRDYHVARDMLSSWREQTRSKFALHMLPGDHFFLRSSQSQLLGLLARELREIIIQPQANIT